jgi:hypothetical protein
LDELGETLEASVGVCVIAETFSQAPHNSLHVGEALLGGKGSIVQRCVPLFIGRLGSDS